ncbi:MAG: COGs COG3558, partial [uncultured Friedmanniella sp.]
APAPAAVHRRNRRPEGAGRRGRVEHPRPAEGRRRLHPGHAVAEPLGVPHRPGRRRGLLDPQVGDRAGLRAPQVPLGLHRQPDRRPVPVRVVRRVGPVVAQPRERELGVRRGGLHASARGQHQRRGHRRGRASHLRLPAGVRAGRRDPAL